MQGRAGPLLRAITIRPATHFFKPHLLAPTCVVLLLNQLAQSALQLGVQVAKGVNLHEIHKDVQC
jgi:hypothetical protein